MTRTTKNEILTMNKDNFKTVLIVRKWKGTTIKEKITRYTDFISTVICDKTFVNSTNIEYFFVD